MGGNLLRRLAAARAIKRYRRKAQRSAVIVTAALMSAFVGAHEQRLTVARLPAYAPELNPVEGAWPTIEEQRGQPRLLQLTASADRHREEPAQAHPVPGRPHPRIPRPDRTQHPTQTSVDPDLRLSSSVASADPRAWSLHRPGGT